MRKTTTKTSIETTGSYAVAGKDPLPIVMEVNGDQLLFRAKGSKRRFTLTIEQAFREAIIRNA